MINVLTYKEKFYKEHNDKKMEHVTRVLERNDIGDNSHAFLQIKMLDIDYSINNIKIKSIGYRNELK